MPRTIQLGSGTLYVVEATQSVTIAGNATASEIATFISTNAVSANAFAEIKGGCTLKYTQSTYTEKDDLGTVEKVAITDETVSLAGNGIAWNGGEIAKLIATASHTADVTNGNVTRIGGIANNNGKKYYCIFEHKDAADINTYVILKGKNVSEISIQFAQGAGAQLPFEFQAEALDSTGRLALYFEKAAS